MRSLRLCCLGSMSICVRIRSFCASIANWNRIRHSGPHIRRISPTVRPKRPNKCVSSRSRSARTISLHTRTIPKITTKTHTRIVTHQQQRNCIFQIEQNLLPTDKPNVMQLATSQTVQNECHVQQTHTKSNRLEYFPIELPSKLRRNHSE